MNKELQDLAWSVLPKEFKEEVKEQFRDGFNDDRNAIGRLFGVDNLLSDAEGEDMLTVSRKEVQNAYLNCDRYFCYKDMPLYLFGSKCLPDENSSKVERLEKNDEPKPFEPKYKQGDKVFNKLDCNVYEVICRTGFYHYALKDFMSDVHEDFLRPYTEPKEHIAENRNLSQDSANCDKQLDNILKNSFSKERRLNIAAMIAQGIMANSNPQMVDMNVERVVDLAILTADTLIAECSLPIN